MIKDFPGDVFIESTWQVTQWHEVCTFLLFFLLPLLPLACAPIRNRWGVKETRWQQQRESARGAEGEIREESRAEEWGRGASNRVKGVVRTKGRWKGGGCGSREKGEGGVGDRNGDTSTTLLYRRTNCRCCFDDSHDCSMFFLFNKLNFDGLLH